MNFPKALLVLSILSAVQSYAGTGDRNKSDRTVPDNIVIEVHDPGLRVYVDSAARIYASSQVPGVESFGKLVEIGKLSGASLDMFVTDLATVPHGSTRLVGAFITRGMRPFYENEIINEVIPRDSVVHSGDLVIYFEKTDGSRKLIGFLNRESVYRKLTSRGQCEGLFSN